MMRMTIVMGYGHGVDSQDKSAGKATTYALKYALLNTFLVPTGDIDDTDNTHSDTYDQPPKTAQKTVLQKPTVSPVSELTGDCQLHGVKVLREYEKKSGEGTFFGHMVDGRWCFGK